MGGWISDDCHINSDTLLSGRTGNYWLKSEGDFFGSVGFVDEEGEAVIFSTEDRTTGARPALPFSSINEIPTNGENGEIKKDKDEVEYVEYGYYPQMAATNQDELEMAYQAKKLTKSGFSYTTDKAQEHEEYIDEKTGKRYVRVIGNSCRLYPELSNEKKYEKGDPVWVEVEPIKWLVDRDAKIMLTDKIIFAGVQFAEKGTKYHTEDFEKTPIKKFMDEHLSKEELFKVLCEKMIEHGYDNQKLNKVYNFCQSIYGDRKRYSGDDYVTHLLNVSLLLVQMEAEEIVIYAGMFCDVFRKTNVAIDELKENLPDSVVQILIRLKDYDIEKVGLEDEQCAVIKIAERLHNMRTIEYMEEREKQKRAKETIAIFMPIVKKLQDDKLISELNEISINCLK